MQILAVDLWLLLMLLVIHVGGRFERAIQVSGRIGHALAAQGQVGAVLEIVYVGVEQGHVRWRIGMMMLYERGRVCRRHNAVAVIVIVVVNSGGGCIWRGRYAIREVERSRRSLRGVWRELMVMRCRRGMICQLIA